MPYSLSGPPPVRLRSAITARRGAAARDYAPKSGAGAIAVARGAASRLLLGYPVGHYAARRLRPDGTHGDTGGLGAEERGVRE